ncbi:MAG: hypothetical protein KGI06_05900 [Candidatus Micrarchaeota archaeon]|nr:hypothetical protein [Candidatus Micrarchaeota archaeon]
MARFGFVGGTYQSISPNFASDFCMNFYPEVIESGTGKSGMGLLGTPGLSLFCSLSGPSVRGFLTFNGRAFACSGTTFYEIFADMTTLVRGTILNDSAVVSMVAGPNQVAIASAGTLYVFDLNANTLTAISSGVITNVGQVDFCDGFYLALLRNSNQIQASNPLDATTWPGASVAQVSVFPDIVVSMKVLHREIWLLGLKAGTTYYDAGSFPFPFQVNSSAGVMEQGSAAANSTAILDNTLFWVGQDSRGGGIAWRANGYVPERISTHAVEYAWRQYSTISDAIAYGYQEEGHSFYVVLFPTANATWVYDVATQQWHERGVWNGFAFTGHRSQFHVYSFGKHLVGDWMSGNIYEMSLAYLSEPQGNIRRVRRSPFVSNEQQYIFHNSLQVDTEVGLGPIPPLLDGQGNPRGPSMILRWSDDSAKTWSNSYSLDCGQAGEYRKRVIWRRLGRSRERIYEVSVSDPVPWRIVDAYLEATGYTLPSERIASQVRKVS